MEQRPSSWLAGMALGLAAAAALLYRGDDALHAAYALAFCTGLVPALEMTLFGLRAVLLTSIEVWREWHPIVEPAVVTPPSAPIEPAPDLEAWRIALVRFFRAGDAAGGFSGEKLTGVVGSDVWPRLVHFYAELGILRDAGSNVGFVWGHGWEQGGLDRILLALTAGKLPFPAGPVPIVNPYIAPAPQRRAPRSSAKGVVIDNQN